MLNRTDLIFANEPEIIVESKRQADTRRLQERAGFLAKLPLILSDSSTPTITKHYALRKAYRLDGLNKDEIALLVPKSYEETMAEETARIIETGNFPKSLLNRDILAQEIKTYLVILEQMQDGYIKQKVLQILREAYRMQGEFV